jgi:DNA invertase Pin-like site-specific DNA recombinase
MMRITLKNNRACLVGYKDLSPTRIGRPPSFTDEQKNAVLRELASGASVSATAKKFQTSRPTILRIKRNAT